MKDLLLRYASYNIWANQRLLTLLSNLPEGQLDKNPGSSFPMMRKTICHLRDAESTWFRRLQLISPVPEPARSFEGFTEFTRTKK